MLPHYLNSRIDAKTFLLPCNLLQRRKDLRHFSVVIGFGLVSTSMERFGAENKSMFCVANKQQMPEFGGYASRSFVVYCGCLRCALKRQV